MKKILVVDDNENIRLLFRAAFDREYRVIEAENGADGLAMVRRERPKIVFLDVMMPGALNGLQALSAIREDPDIGNTTVYLVTGRDSAEDYVNAEKHGADGYVVKPFSVTDLHKLVQSHLPREQP
jgi:twitching motility two-component system response regulator PilH